MDSNYFLPLRPGRLLGSRQHPHGPIAESVAQFIHLLLLTRPGEHHYDREFGCPTWNEDFTTIHSVSSWRDGLRVTVETLLEGYEKRLTGIDVDIEVDELEFGTKEHRRIRKRIRIRIKGVLKATQEPFEFLEELFFSPIAMD